MKRFILLIILSGCVRTAPAPLSSQDSVRIVGDIVAHRAQVDSFFRYSPYSPFLRDSTIEFRGINWYPPDTRYVFKSLLYPYKTPEPVTIYGTRGEARPMLKHGYFVMNSSGREYRLNVYKSAETGDALSVWFTDSTTGKETYNVGRYIDVGEDRHEPGYLYTIDFNSAFNPYCAYSGLYSCAIPRKEDFLDIAIRAGEMKYH